MENPNIKKPCVVQTPQGFSVYYKERFLYSKYNPQKLILQTIEKQVVLPGTIILVISPLLGYGLKELYEKIPENCLIILCEKEKELYDFAKEQIKIPDFVKNIIFPEPQKLVNLPFFLYDLCQNGNYKRVIRIDFSAGWQFNKDFFESLEEASTNSVMTFWKNRVTLTKFGRKYSQNLFCNLKILENTFPIRNYFNSVTKPIIVFGAGQSVDAFINEPPIDYSRYFVICVDTILPSLKKRNIKIDAVFIEEAQSVISKALIGNLEGNFKIFAGLSSTKLLSHFIKSQNLSFFTTIYSQTKFFKKQDSAFSLPSKNQPFGSVGLTAVYYALNFRKDTNIPVYITGLDFSYSPGLTHAKGSLAHIQSLATTNKLKPLQNYQAAFSSTSIKFTDKSNNIFYTSPNLQGYAENFNQIFSKEENLFDLGKCGIPLEIPHLQKIPKQVKNPQYKENLIKNELFTFEEKQKIREYLKNEKNELVELKKLLTGQIKLSEDEQKKAILQSVQDKEYLYLHFADGHRFEYNQSFLNRIRTEIDFFLKCF